MNERGFVTVNQDVGDFRDALLVGPCSMHGGALSTFNIKCHVRLWSIAQSVASLLHMNFFLREGCKLQRERWMEQLCAFRRIGARAVKRYLYDDGS